jgi:hypothetical protein
MEQPKIPNDGMQYEGLRLRAEAIGRMPGADLIVNMPILALRKLPSADTQFGHCDRFPL